MIQLQIERPEHENPKVAIGDLCVIHISETQRLTLKIEPNNEVQTKFGLVRANELLGQPYGKKFQCKRGWVIPLRLTPELWTQLLPHRTQILYQADISMILFQLDIKPGSIVIESGTGSGSLSHAILRACRPNGFLYTFDINETRVAEARNEFTSHGYGDNVRVEQRNVCDLGFTDDLVGKVDACILDLPQTWLAIEHANKVLKKDGSRLCTFSPCIEQVQMNVTKMNELQMKDIITLETLMKPHEVKVQSLRVWTEDILSQLTAVDKKRIENLEKSLPKSKRKKIAEMDGGPVIETNLNDIVSLQDNGSFGLTRLHKETPDSHSSSLDRALTDPTFPFHSCMLPKCHQLVTKPPIESVGHSGYLTLATKRL